MLPTMKIGDLDVTRLVVGTNPFVGKSHLSEELNLELRTYYTEERIFRTLRRCEEAGINAVQSRGSMPMMGVIDRYRKNGGKLLYLCQSAKNAATFTEELEELLKYNPSAVCIHGELTDDLYMTGNIDRLGKLIDEVRTTAAKKHMNIPVGVCAHFPEALAYCEEKQWKPDYYMASLYNILQPDRSHDLNPTGERFEDSDIPKMYAVIRNLSAPVIALKILGAGRRCATQEQVKAAFVEAFASMKRGDGVLVGMYDGRIDQPFLNARYTAEALSHLI